jgi:methylmalonyl-CoA/ethylmalonyl-CoA epimerase
VSNRLTAPGVNQVCVVVRNIDAAMRHYWEMLGIGPWSVYTFNPALVKEMTYRGRRQDYSIRLALAQAGALLFEIIQPLSGETIFNEHLERRGEGLHHIGVFVPSYDQAVAEAVAKGYSVIQSGRGYGRWGDGGYAFLDTEQTLGLVVELIEVPRERVKPERRFPAET